MYQYCIVGGGPSGLVLANELRNTVPEESIVILEAGGVTEQNEDAAKFISIGKTDYKPIRSFRLGGHGHLWGGACPRLHENDFRMQSRFGLYVDWPFGYSELEPYYARAEELLSVESNGTEFPSNIDNDPIANGLSKSGYMGSLPYGNQRFFTEQLMPELQKSNVEIKSGCVVNFIDEINGVSKISYHDTNSGTVRVIYAHNVILCCGGLSNARILQMSKSERFPTGLGDHSGFLGRYHMDHPRIIASISRVYSAQGGGLRRDGRLPMTLVKVVDNIRPYLAFASISINRENNASIDKLNLDSTLHQYAHVDDLQNNLLRMIDIEDKVVFDFETMDPPGQHNMLGLAEKLDVYGDPMLATNINIDAERNKVDSSILQILGDVFQEYGYYVVSLRKSGWTGQHPSGSTRMAETKEDGVVDANLKVFNTESVYVLGSSVFPTVGYANPTLTIVSLAIRLAEHLVSVNNGKS